MSRERTHRALEALFYAGVDMPECTADRHTAVCNALHSQLCAERITVRDKCARVVSDWGEVLGKESLGKARVAADIYRAIKQVDA